jgi:hypothetical protein
MPTWDDQTEYEAGSLVMENPYIFKALQQHTNQKPEIGSAYWEVIGQFLDNLDDVQITPPSDNTEKHILRYDSGLWKNIDIDDITSNMLLEDIGNVLVDNTQLQVGYALSGKPDNDLFNWYHLSPSEAVQDDEVTTWRACMDVQDAEPQIDDVVYFDGNVWKIQPNIMPTTTWDKILNPPDEYQPPFSTPDTLGGAKMERRGLSLFIRTKPEDAPGQPTGLSAFSGDSTKIEIYWGPPMDGELAYTYNIYRDEKKIQGGVLDPYYEDIAVLPDRDYTYFVKGVNQYGEGPQSNYIQAHTYTVPAAPFALDYYIRGNEVELVWQEPETTSGEITYNIYRDNTLLGNSYLPNYIDTNVATGNHTYYVTAQNKYYESDASNTVFVVII